MQLAQTLGVSEADAAATIGQLNGITADEARAQFMKGGYVQGKPFVDSKKQGAFQDFGGAKGVAQSFQTGDDDIMKMIMLGPDDY